MSDAFQHGWALVKMPFVQTALDNLRMVHHEPSSNVSERSIGSQPPNWTMHRDSIIGDTTVEQMSPNEYFDYISLGNGGGLVGGAEDEWRWEPHEDSKDYIRYLVNRLQNEKDIEMGMPSLQIEEMLSGKERNNWQEGGHRMEALRQLKHGDTKFPVLVARRKEEL